MSDAVKQSQKTGDHSFNLQAQEITINSLTVTEACQIALDVFRANALELAGIARDLFETRGKEFIDRYLEELSRRKPAAVDALRDPDMQYALFTAQKEYARTGDVEMSDLLVDILVDRAEQKSRTLKQIVLNESLTIAPKLTSQQFDILSLCFIVRYTKSLGLRNLADFHNSVISSMLPFCDNIPEHDAPYQHLEFAGCASIVTFSKSLPALLRLNYAGLLCKGFSRDEFSEIVEVNQWLGKLLIPCFHNPTLLQVAALDLDSIERVCDQVAVPPEHRPRIRAVQEAHLMSDDEITVYLKENVPGSGRLLDSWHNSALKNLTLTSVGIAIGHANIRRKTKRDVYNLDIWIPD